MHKTYTTLKARLEIQRCIFHTKVRHFTQKVELFNKNENFEVYQ